MKYIPIVGLMSGTSLDGIDTSFIFSNGKSVKRTNCNLIKPYSRKTKILLEQVLKHPQKIIHDDLLRTKLEKLITLDHIKAIDNIIAKFNIKPELISLHGQTIYHNPRKNISVQLIDANKISKRFNIDVIYNFRNKDLLHGGQGAPIAPIYHKLIIKEKKLSLPTVIVNIGGIANVTYWDGKSLIGFDTGPGNSLMDKYMKNKLKKNYDNLGFIASKGNINYSHVKEYCKKSFLKKIYPKSLDITDVFCDKLFNSLNVMNPEDAMSTLCFITAKTIQLNITLLPKKPKNILICGGGQNNLTLISMLKKILHGNVLTSQTINLDGNYFESELMCFLGARRIYNLPSTFSSTTGACKDIVCGEIAYYKKLDQ